MAAPAWLDTRAYPFELRAHRTAEGVMSYVDEGHGPAVVMVHGNPAWSFAYRGVIRGLLPDVRCIAVDHLGFGLSEKPEGADHSPVAHARRFASLMDALDLEDATLMVQDWGGPIGLSYALARPEKVRRLVIMNTWMWPVNGDPHYERFSRLMGGPLGRSAIRRFNAFVLGVMPRAVADRKRSLPPHILSQYANALPDARSRTACAALPGQILGSSAWLGDLWARRDTLRRMHALILWGERDIAFRAKELATWERALPDAEVVRFPDAGHYVQEEKSAEVAQRVRAWMARTAPKRVAA